MIADSVELPPEVARVRSALRAWFTSKRSTHVELREQFNRKLDGSDDYLVIYEAIFEPTSLDRARLEVWVTSGGYTGVGIETRARIAQRLDIRKLRDGFAAGHEPAAISMSATIALFDEIAAGGVAIHATTLPILGLVSTSARIAKQTRRRLIERGYSLVRWLHEDGERDGGVVRFQQW